MYIEYNVLYSTQLMIWYSTHYSEYNRVQYFFFFWTLLTPRLIKYLKWFGSYFHTQIHSLTHLTARQSAPNFS